METPKKIFIVDDDVDVIESMEIPLVANGFKVSSTTDPTKVLDIMEKEKPDLVFLDVIFPGNSTAGFEVCREIKGNPKFKNTTVIILSAINQQFNMAFTAQKKTRDWLPSDLFLEKPLDVELLLKIVKHFQKTGNLNYESRS